MTLRLFSVLLTVLFWSSVVASLVVLVYPDLPGSVAVAVEPLDDPFVVEAAEPATGTPILTDLEGEIALPGPVPWSLRLFLAASLCVGAVVLQPLRRVVRTVDAGRPFVTENVERLRRLGWIVLVAPFLLSLVARLTVHGVVSDLVVRGASVYVPHRLSLGFVGVALALFVLAEVFRQGVEREREAEVYRRGLELAGRGASGDGEPG